MKIFKSIFRIGKSFFFFLHCDVIFFSLSCQCRSWQIHFWSTGPRANSSAKFTCPTFKSTCHTIKTLHSGKNKKMIYIYQHSICFVFPFNKEPGNLFIKLQVKTVLKSSQWVSLCISYKGKFSVFQCNELINYCSGWH